MIAIFIPLLFMRGIVGRLFREFSLTLSAAIVVSAIVSLTLTPMMCARLLTPDAEATASAWLAGPERAFAATLRFYGRSLAWVMRHETVTLAVAIATLVLTVVLYTTIPRGFLPAQDTGVIIATTDAAPEIPFSKMAALQAKAAEIALNDPGVAGLDSFVGVGVVNSTPNTGRMIIVLKRRSDRADAAPEITRRLRTALSQIAGLSVYLQRAPEIQIGTRATRTQYQYILVDANPTELVRVAPLLLERLQSSPALRDVASDHQPGGLVADVVIDRDQAGRLGVLPQTIDDTLYDAFGQRQVSTIYTQPDRCTAAKTCRLQV
jgi:multidrug efflux pump